MHEFAAGFYHFDSLPADGRITSGHLLRGWILTKRYQPFVDVRMRCGGEKIVTVYGLPRADLSNVFGARRPFLPAEFESRLDLPPGQTELQLEGLDMSGEWRSVTTVTLTVVTQPLEGGPSLPKSTGQEPPLRAHEFSRALRVVLSASPDQPAAAATLAGSTPWPPAARHPHQPFHGFLDEPAALSRSDFGRVHVSGWLFHETASLRTVVASFDLIGFEPLTVGGAFPGVAERFPRFANAANCRLHGVVDAPSQLAADACLRVFAETDDGSWHLCHVQRTFLIDHEQEKRTTPACSAFGFIRAARQLRRRYEENGTPVETGSAMRAELWKTWRALPTSNAVQPMPRPLSPPPSRAGGTEADPRRILLITHNLALEGASLFLAEYAEQWHRRGVGISVVSGSDGPLRARYEALPAEVQLVAVAGLARASTANALRREIAAVSRAIEWANFDLVVVNTLACYWAIHAADAAGRPTLFYIHESTTPERFFLGRLAPAVIPLVEESFALARHVSFLAEATRRYYAPFCRDNTSINAGWLDLPALEAVRQRGATPAARTAIGLREQERLVVNLGTVCDRKGQTLYARMVELLWQNDPVTAAKFRFAIVGARDSLYDASLRALVRDLGRPNVQIVPETADVFAWYVSAEVFVCSSFEESFPRVILEAMGFGLGIVSTDVHAIPEIVRHGQEALLFPAGNTAAGAAALQRMLADERLRQTLGAAARARVESHYTLETVFPRHQALARRILQR